MFDPVSYAAGKSAGSKGSGGNQNSVVTHTFTGAELPNTASVDSVGFFAPFSWAEVGPAIDHFLLHYEEDEEGNRTEIIDAFVPGDFTVWGTITRGGTVFPLSCFAYRGIESANPNCLLSIRRANASSAYMNIRTSGMFLGALSADDVLSITISHHPLPTT